jgi:hypothetical protein
MRYGYAFPFAGAYLLTQIQSLTCQSASEYLQMHVQGARQAYGQTR